MLIHNLLNSLIPLIQYEIKHGYPFDELSEQYLVEPDLVEVNNGPLNGDQNVDGLIEGVVVVVNDHEYVDYATEEEYEGKEIQFNFCHFDKVKTANTISFLIVYFPV